MSSAACILPRGNILPCSAGLEDLEYELHTFESMLISSLPSLAIRRVFGGDQVTKIMDSFRLSDDIPIENKQVGHSNSRDVGPLNDDSSHVH